MPAQPWHTARRPTAQEVVEYEGEVATMQPGERVLALRAVGVPPSNSPEANKRLLERLELT